MCLRVSPWRNRKADKDNIQCTDLENLARVCILQQHPNAQRFLSGVAHKCRAQRCVLYVRSSPSRSYLHAISGWFVVIVHAHLSGELLRFHPFEKNLVVPPCRSRFYSGSNPRLHGQHTQKRVRPLFLSCWAPSQGFRSLPVSNICTSSNRGESRIWNNIYL